MKSRKAGWLLAVVAVLSSPLVTGCQESATDPAVILDDQEVFLAMEAAIQDEYRAELIYEKVLGDYGPVRPFVNIVNAEVRHSEALARLYEARGLPVPQSRWSPDEIPGFPSISEACRAGVDAEIENAEIYEHYMDLPLPDDVRFVFENNQRASLENHLPAFQRCS
jgi:hypothetical protein